jgi:ATP-dependent phosphoenolpyruvate carboxykinase
VREYVAVIHHALQLSEESVKSVQGCLQTTKPVPLSAATIQGFSKLQTFIVSVRNLLNPIRAEGSLAILPFLEELQERTWERLRSLLSEYVSSSFVFPFLHIYTGGSWKHRKRLNGRLPYHTTQSLHPTESTLKYPSLTSSASKISTFPRFLS